MQLSLSVIEDHRDLRSISLTDSVNKIIWRFWGNLEKKVLVAKFPHFF